MQMAHHRPARARGYFEEARRPSLADAVAAGTAFDVPADLADEAGFWADTRVGITVLAWSAYCGSDARDEAVRRATERRALSGLLVPAARAIRANWPHSDGRCLDLLVRAFGGVWFALRAEVADGVPTVTLMAPTEG